MLLIRNKGDAKAALSPDQHLEFIKKCETYIASLKSAGKLIAAQPLIREGIILTRINDTWKKDPLKEDTEVQVGYYHILADDMQDAVAIARQNPEYEYVPSASIEIRPIKTKEADTGFVYPKK